MGNRPSSGIISNVAVGGSGADGTGNVKRQQSPINIGENLKIF
jgi:hypothetical protein